MSKDLARMRQAELASVDLERLAEKASSFMAGHLADSTKRAYAHDYRIYDEWCRAAGMETMPADPLVIALYIAAMADEGLAASSIDRAIAGIAKAHEMKGLKFDRKHRAIKQALSGMRKALGTRPKQVEAITTSELRLMVETQPTTDYRGIRNRALLTFGFAGAFRRSELAALLTTDIRVVPEGYRVLIRKSKTDQEGAGQEIGIPYGQFPTTCPVHNMNEWLQLRGTKPEGPLFCGMNRKATVLYTHIPITGRLVARTVQLTAALAGFGGDEGKRVAGHSLRAGLVTAADLAGKSVADIQAMTRHKSVEMVMKYIRKEGLFKNNAAEGIGL